MSNFDHYAAAKELISLLERDGRTTDASNLRSAMEEGSTGTEIFMALRFYLSEMIQRGQLEANLQALASKIVAEMDDALK
jgi:hypothetical protein